MRLDEEPNAVTVEGNGYRLALTADPWMTLTDRAGTVWARLFRAIALNPIGGRDETFGIAPPSVELSPDGVRVSWTCGSTAWTSKRIVLDCTDDGFVLHAEVEGDGRVAEVTFCASHAVLASGASGWFASDRRFATILEPAPRDPGSVTTSADTSCDISAAGGPQAGRPGWFFTPGPLCYSVSLARAADRASIPAGPWMSFGLAASRAAEGFIGFGYRAAPSGFHLEIDYEGHTRVAGRWTSPGLRVAPASDPYDAIAVYRAWLASVGLLAVAPAPSRTPTWWRQPMFCGWGAECALAMAEHGSMARAAEYATQANYDNFLDRLAVAGIVPGTVVIDDRWEEVYGSGRPDAAKWPDLRGWIDYRHALGQRVLLWWKAWDPTSFPADQCVTDPAGMRVAVDPGNPAARAGIASAIRGMVAPDGLDADGLKIDFTARTPTGTSLAHSGDTWGIALLRQLLETIRDAAKAAKPDALLVGQVPEPTLAPLLDAIRLNDILRLDDPDPRIAIVPAMDHRAAVVRAACPDHLIDTDDWCVPDLSEWRAYAERKAALGIPALYYVDRLDFSGEALTAPDHDLIRRTWAAYRREHGSDEPTPTVGV